MLEKVKGGRVYVEEVVRSVIKVFVKYGAGNVKLREIEINVIVTLAIYL